MSDGADEYEIQRYNKRVPPALIMQNLKEEKKTVERNMRKNNFEEKYKSCLLITGLETNQ